MYPIIKINRSEIIGVPAIHNRAVFAREVNYLCSARETRPEAIAVELGPHIVAELVTWMKELGISRRAGTWLPCMLGLLIENRFIHPDLAKNAMNLQENLYKPLSGISADLLKKLLYFSGKYLVALSATDSIIEAIRCSVELDIPVFGIDMDEMSAKPDKILLVEEPVHSSFNLQNYVSGNESHAAETRDLYVDSRREFVMAARLKRISEIYKKILVTGGIAHWVKIKELLSDPAVRPAEILFPTLNLKLQRSVIHPLMALAFMDIYPVMTTLYEKSRHFPRRNFKFRFDLPDTNKLFRGILDTTYEEYYREYGNSGFKGSGKNCMEKIPDFERLLANISIIRQHHSPSMADIMECSENMMPDSFNGLLMSRLMNTDRPWASLKQFPDLPLLSGMPRDDEDTERKTGIDHFLLTDSAKDNYGSYTIPGYQEESFTLRYHNSNSISSVPPGAWSWADDPNRKYHKSNYYVWVWPPCEALTFGLAYEASRVARTRSEEPSPAVFEGSLYNGLDIKATMRSVISGDKKIMIKKPSAEKKVFTPDGKHPEPTVFIFDEDKTDPASVWSLLIAGTNLAGNVKNRSRFENLTNAKGRCFISSISRVKKYAIPPSMRGHIDSFDFLDGYTVLGNPCINARQAAQWLEDNDYNCCPLMTDTSISSLISYYKRHFNLELSDKDWITTLIQIAIPYTKERFVVIGPKTLRIPDKLNTEARRRKISIDFLPLNYFPDQLVSEMRRRIMLRASDPDGLTYTPEAEKAIGQKADKYFELLPLYMQLQLKKQKNY